MNIRESSYGYWSSHRAFTWVAVGAMLGVGNAIRLPALMGEYGGVLFLMVYLLGLLLVGLPLLIAEWMLGRWMRDDLIAGFARLVESAHAKRVWVAIGGLALLTAGLILSYYSVIAGWSLAYTFRAASGMFGHLTADGASDVFLHLAKDPERSLSWHTLFILTACVVVSHGFREGVERASRRLVPFVVLMVLAMCWYAFRHGDASAAFDYIFEPHWERLGWRGVMEALHHAFFTLGLGMGVMMGVGSYLPVDAPLRRVALTVMLVDTVFSLLVGLAVMAVVLGAGLQPTSGITLMFQTLPRAIGGDFGGSMFAAGLFLMTFIVTMTSATAMLEPLSRYFMDRQRWTRVFAATSAALLIWFIGLGTLLSFSVMQNMRLLGRNFFEWVQWLTTSWFAPLDGLLICVFVVSIMPRELVRHLWGETRAWLYPVWFTLLRYPARLGLIAVLVYSTGLLDWLVSLWGN
ncbi:sodium-dependent transporter [Solimonas terrae]|uniref:Sodium-dependent transporter n=1 Tax=Solimonas terrae TaxID=1396819 RepID=A0A6M2BVK4_9GAMM|nr:sodium-dependent transporter [Solimonas terrae]NGY06285.1 sodium-dependent transporter [Solimonas terrae]